MKMLRLALVLPAFVLLLAAAGAARAATFFARLEKDPLLRRQRPATKPNAALLGHQVLLQHSPQALSLGYSAPPKTNNDTNSTPAPLNLTLRCQRKRVNSSFAPIPRTGSTPCRNGG